MPPARPIICAHRGVSAHYPENTLVAVSAAADFGSRQAEIDVRKTSDGHIVLMHDAAVDRTTNGTGEVADLTLAQIQTLDAGSWKSTDFAGEKVPTFAEVLALCRERGMCLCTEIKQHGIGPEVVRVVEEVGMVEASVIISFNLDTAVQVREANPCITTGFLTARIELADLDTMIDRVLSHGIPVISALHSQVTPEVVQRCRLRGVTLYAWTIDDEETARLYADMGVDVIASNRPREIMVALG